MNKDIKREGEKGFLTIKANMGSQNWISIKTDDGEEIRILIGKKHARNKVNISIEAPKSFTIKREY